MSGRRRSREATSLPRYKRRVEFEYVDLHDIKPYEHNPRQNAEAVRFVEASIRDFGFLIPMVLDDDGVIVAGHTRYEAAIRLHMDEVPAIRARFLTDEQIRQFRIIDNKTAEAAKWDMDLLAGEFAALQASGIDFTQFGFSQHEIDCLSDVVADDCLSGGLVASLDGDQRRRRAEQRAPRTTRFVFGEFVFFVEASVYKDWATQLRADHDFDEKECIKGIKEMLGLSQE